MACDPNSLIADVAQFQGASDRQLRLIKLALLIQWSGTSSTLQELLDSVTAFQSLSFKQLQMIVVALYCQLSGG